jgi:ATP-dependent Clp protease ATP-binding subunit ClpA
LSEALREERLLSPAHAARAPQQPHSLAPPSSNNTHARTHWRAHITPGIPVSKLVAGEREKLLELPDVLHRRVVGQGDAVEAVADAIQRSRCVLWRAARVLGCVPACVHACASLDRSLPAAPPQPFWLAHTTPQ